MSRFKEQLKTQLRFLKRSCEEFDKGDAAEFVRIATHVCTICDDAGRNTVSILTHMGNKDIKLLSSSVNPLNAGDSSPFGNLTNLEIKPMVGGRFVPLYGQGQKNEISIEQWWTGETVFSRQQIEICRRDLIRWARDKDGGAHVDEDLPAEYVELLDGGAGLVMNIHPDNGPERTVAFENAPQATIRQIGFEVLNSPDLIELAR